MTRLMFSYQLRTLNCFVDFKIFLLFVLFICETFFCNLLPDYRENNCLILFEYFGNNTQMSTITQNLCSVRSFLIRLKLIDSKIIQGKLGEGAFYILASCWRVVMDTPICQWSKIFKKCLMPEYKTKLSTSIF